MSRNHFRELLHTLQEEQSSFRDELRDDEGSGGGGSAPRAVAPRPQREFVEFKNLWEPAEDVSWSIQLSRTQPADFPSQMSVFEAAKCEAQRITGEVLAGLTATCNTAVKFTTHGAEVSVFAGVEEVLNILCCEFFVDYHAFEDDPFRRFEELGPAKFYGRLLKAPGGIFVRCENKLGASHVSVELKGEAFEVYGMVPFARFLTRVHESGVRWHLTRIDNAWDGVEFTPHKLFRELKRGNVRSLAQRDTVKWCDTPFGDEAGQTCYFGRRGSADHLRCYNKRETGTRLEHECRRNRAKLLGLMLVHTPLERWAEIALANLRDFVDFVKRAEGENVTRAKPLKFWSKFVGDVQRMKVSMADLAGTVRQQVQVTTQKVQAVVKAISRRVNVLARAVGWDVMREMMQREEYRLRPSDAARADQVKTVVARAVEIYETSVSEIFSGCRALLGPRVECG